MYGYNNQYQGMAAPQDTIIVPWKGYYVQNGQQCPMNLDNLMITTQGRIFCDGSDQVGGFRIDGQVNPNGSFFFNKQYHGQHCVNYNGTIRSGELVGNWSVQGLRDEFCISIDAQEWQGSFTMDGTTYSMKTKLYVSESGIFSIGKDSEGVFITLGDYDGSTSSLYYTKQYLGKYSLQYTGTMYDDGQYLVVHGNWTLSTGQSGAFEMYQLIEGRAEQYRQFYSPPPPPQSYVPTFYGMPQNQIPQQYHSGMNMGGGYGQPVQMSGPLSDSDLIDGDAYSIQMIMAKLQSGMYIKGSQLQMFLPMITDPTSVLLFCKNLNENSLRDFTMDNLLEGLVRCKNPDNNKHLVIQLHPLVRPVPGALQNSKLSKLFVFNSDRQEVSSALKIDI